MKKVRIIVSGRVQGVNFRWVTRRRASSLGVNGYVKNLPDGNVEIVAEGEEPNVDRLIAWARSGPPAAQVDDLEIEELPFERDFWNFIIKH